MDALNLSAASSHHPLFLYANASYTQVNPLSSLSLSLSLLDLLAGLSSRVRFFPLCTPFLDSLWQKDFER